MENYDTLKFYNENAEKYCEQTINGDMTEAYNSFMVFLPDKAYILDFGCGSGRDSKFFIEKGYTVRAIDGSKELCKLASKYIGQKVDELNDESMYDGIWACSSILHVEREQLPDILRKMIRAIKEDGVIYASFKIGDKEIVQDGKYYNYITKEVFEDMLMRIDPSSKIVEYYETGTCKDVNRPTAAWGNYLIKKKI